MTLNKTLSRQSTMCFRSAMCYLLLLLPFAGFAQSGGGSVPVGDILAPSTEMIPPSPNAASLGTYGEIPVALHTGLPEISIPLYEIRSGSLVVPISLKYHAAGIKVADRGTWTGIGWTLHAGGVITRTKRGLPDEFNASNHITGFMANAHKVPHKSAMQQQLTWINGSSAAQNRIINKHFEAQDIINGIQDYFPDMFFYNILGNSGKMMIGNDKKFHFLNASPYKIESSIENVSQPSEGEFIITDDKGVKYYFGKSGATEISHVSWTLDYYNFSPDYASSWYLTKIESADKQDVIEFRLCGRKYGSLI